MSRSFFFFLSGKLVKSYLCFEDWLIGVFWDSGAVKKFFIKFINLLKICFGNSLLFRLAESGLIPELIIESKTAGLTRGLYRRCESMISESALISRTYGILGHLKKEFFLYPVKSASILSLFFLSMNISFSFKVAIGFDFLSWLTRVMIFFFSIFGLFCDTSWSATKESSVFLRRSNG